MTRTINDGFNTFQGWLTPTATETSAAKSHRASIKACLENNFEVTRFFRSGSFGNGTSVRGYSDVDYFAVIPERKIRSSGRATLNAVWRALDDRFPNTGVGIRTPAIWLPFGTDACESTDVVPAKYSHQTNGYSVYNIPSRDGGWMITSPDAHTQYIVDLDKKLSNKLKPLIRFIKAWKYYKTVPIFSFYLEMAVAKYAEKETYINYSHDIQRFLDRLWKNNLSALQDPVGISGYIYPCVSEAYKNDAYSKLETASSRADKAWEAEEAGKIKDAFYYWDLLFDGQFPAYY
jgi:hypothetical protein